MLYKIITCRYKMSNTSNFENAIRSIYNSENLTCDKYIALQNNILDKYYKDERSASDYIITLNNIDNIQFNEYVSASNDIETYNVDQNTNQDDEEDKKDQDTVKLYENINDINLLITSLNTKLLELKGTILLEITKINERQKDLSKFKKDTSKTFKHLSTIEQHIHQLGNEKNVDITQFNDNFKIQKHNVIDSTISQALVDYEDYNKSVKKLNTISNLYKINKSKNVKLCSICLSNELAYFLSPCGHTFCDQCVKRIANERCYICRQSFNSKHKLYIS